MDVREYVRDKVKGGACVGVGELVDEASSALGVPRSEAAYEVFLMWKSGEIEVEGYPYDGVLPYFFTVEGLWFWAMAAAVLASLASLLIGGGPLLPVRYVLGTVFTLFLPGYALVEALYPRGDELGPLERLALSIGLSLAVVPLLGLLLNYTPWGIRLGPVTAALALFVLALSALAAVRKARALALGRGGGVGGGC